MKIQKKFEKITLVIETDAELGALQVLSDSCEDIGGVSGVEVGVFLVELKALLSENASISDCFSVALETRIEGGDVDGQQEDCRLDNDQLSDKAMIGDLLMGLEEEVVQYVDDGIERLVANGSIDIKNKLAYAFSKSEFYNKLQRLCDSVAVQRRSYDESNNFVGRMSGMVDALNGDSGMVDKIGTYNAKIEISESLELRMWWHDCKVDGMVATENGHECNWCGECED